MQATIEEGKRVDFSSIEQLAQEEYQSMQVPATFTFDAGAVVHPTLDTTASTPDPETVRQYELDQKIDEFMDYYNSRSEVTPEPVVEQQRGFLGKLADYASSAFDTVKSVLGYETSFKKVALAVATVAALAMPAYGQSCGDGDGDGDVDIIDSLHSAQISAGLTTSVDDAGEQRLDVTGPNGVTILDSLRIAQFSAGLDPEGTGFLYCATNDAGLARLYQHGDTGAATPSVDRENSTSFVFQHYTIPGTMITLMPSMELGDGVVYGPDGTRNQAIDGLVAQVATMPGQNLATFYGTFDTPIDPATLAGKEIAYQGAVVTVTEATISPSLHRLMLEGGMDVTLDGSPQTFDTGSAMWENVTAVMTSPSEAMVDVNGEMIVANVGSVMPVSTLPNSYLMVTAVSPTQVEVKIEYCILAFEDADPMNPAYTGTFSSWGVPQPNVRTKIETAGGNISRIVQAIDEPAGMQAPSRVLVDPEGGLPLESLLRPEWKGTNAYAIQFPGRVESGQTTTHAFEQDALNDDVINLTYTLPDGLTQVVDQPFYGNSSGFGSARLFFNMDERGSTDPHPVKEGDKFLFTAYDGLKWVSEIMTYQNLAGGNLNLLRGDGTPFQVSVGQDITIPTEGGRTASQNYEVGVANALAVNNDSNPSLEVDQQALFYLHTPGADHNHYLTFHTNDINPDGTVGAGAPGTTTLFFDVIEPSELYPLGSQSNGFFEVAFVDNATNSQMFINPFGTTTTTMVGSEEHKLFPSLSVVYRGLTAPYTFDTTGPTYAPLDIKKIDPSP